jgi:hypothetical protein
LEEAVLAHQGGTSRDDLAVLVLKRLGRRSNPVARSKSASALPREDDHG